MEKTLRGYGADAWIIGSGTRIVARAAARLLRSPFPVLYDPDRAVYRAWGLEKRLGLVQQSGTFVVDAEGTVRLAHPATNPARSLPREELIAVLAALAEAGPEGP